MKGHRDRTFIACWSEKFREFYGRCHLPIRPFRGLLTPSGNHARLRRGDVVSGPIIEQSLITVKYVRPSQIAKTPTVDWIFAAHDRFLSCEYFLWLLWFHSLSHSRIGDSINQQKFVRIRKSSLSSSEVVKFDIRCIFECKKKVSPSMMQNNVNLSGRCSKRFGDRMEGLWGRQAADIPRSKPIFCTLLP